MMRLPLHLVPLMLGLCGCAGSVTPSNDDDTTPTDDDDSTINDDDSGDDDTPPEDLDGDGFSVTDGDCDDSDPRRHPGASETCSGIDEDCDGLVDEDVPVVPLPPGDYPLAAAAARFPGPTDDGSASYGTYLHQIGDTNGDGIEDLMIPSVLGKLVFLGPFCDREYSHSEAVATLETTEWTLGSTYLGDVNGDGLDDIRLEGSVLFAPFSGTYTWADGDLILDWGMATSMQAADLDGDGYQDLVAGHYGYDQVVFFAGPLEGPILDTSTAAVVTANNPQGWVLRFGWSLTTLVSAQGATTVVMDGADRIFLIDGLPSPGTSVATQELPIPQLFQEPTFRVGESIVSDGTDRLCISDSAPQNPEAVCGTLAELDSGTVAEWFGPPLEGASRWLGVTPELWAAGGPATEVDGERFAGRVEVRGASGTWTFSFDSGDPNAGFGQGIALLADRPRNITWLAAAAPFEDIGEPGGAEGAVYLFPLDAPPPPKWR